VPRLDGKRYLICHLEGFGAGDLMEWTAAASRAGML
jgi:hypothetical protein